MKRHVPVLCALLATWVLLPVGAQAQAQAQAPASQANALEREMESLLRCGQPKVSDRAIQILRELGFKYDGEHYLAPKGKKVMVFGEEVLAASAFRNQGPPGRGGDHGGMVEIVLKPPKMHLSAMHPVAKRMGLTKRDYSDVDEVDVGYNRNMTANSSVSLRLRGFSQKLSGVMITCAWH